MSGNQERDEIEALLERHYTVPPPTEPFAKALEDRVKWEQSRLAMDRQAEAVDFESGARRGHTSGLRGTRVLRRSVLVVVGVAACLAVVIALPLALRYMRDLPRDRVLAAIQQARVMHVVSLQQFDDGSWKEQELVYRRGGSLVEVRYLDGRSSVLVDDGRSAWEYGLGDLLRGPAYDPAVKVATLAKAVGTEWISPSLSREASADRSIHGNWCRAYRTTSRGGTCQVRIWIDGSDHVRRCETSRLRGRAWIPVRIAQVYYGTPPDGFHLFGDVDASPEILDTAKPLKRRFDLQKAIFAKQVGETIFAVHEVTRCEDGLVFLVCSSRSAERDSGEDAADAAGGAGRSSSPGQFAVSFDWRAGATAMGRAVPLLPWELRRTSRDGLDLVWYVLGPQQSRLTPEVGDMDRRSLHLRVTMRGTDPSDRRPDDALFETVIEVPPVAQTVPLAHIVARVYSDALVAGAPFDASQPKTGQTVPPGVGPPFSSFAVPGWLASLRSDRQHCPGMAGMPARNVPNVDG